MFQILWIRVQLPVDKLWDIRLHAYLIIASASRGTQARDFEEVVFFIQLGKFGLAKLVQIFGHTEIGFDVLRNHGKNQLTPSSAVPVAIVKLGHFQS